MSASKYLLLVYSNLVFSLIYAEDVCITNGACSCEFSNGTGISLSSTPERIYSAQIFEEKGNSTEYELSTYYYHPCNDIVMKINASDANTCNQPLSLCRHVSKLKLSNGTFKMNGTAYDYMGASKLCNFTSDGSSIIYYNGPSITIVKLICANTENTLNVYSLEEPNAIVLSFYSRDACLKEIETGRSFGSTLLVLFFSLLLFYLIIGIGTKIFLMGATGIEIVPHLGFWTDLPYLVKDGWMFALNGFKLPTRGSGPMTSPDPNSYDSI